MPLHLRSRLRFSAHAVDRYWARGGIARPRRDRVEAALLAALHAGVEPDEDLGVAVEVDGMVWVCQPAIEGGWIAVTSLKAEPGVDIRQYLRQVREEREQIEAAFNEVTEPDLIESIGYQLKALEIRENHLWRQAKEETA